MIIFIQLNNIIQNMTYKEIKSNDVDIQILKDIENSKW